VELNKVVEGAVVLAVVFGAIVERCTVWAERCSDDDTAVRIVCDSLPGKRYGAQKSGIGAGGIDANLGVTHAGDLIAGRFDDVRTGLDVGAMDGNDFWGCIFEDVRGPEGAVDVGAEILEFGGHASIEDVEALKKPRSC